MSSVSPAPAPAAALGDPHRWAILFIVLAAEVVDLVDSTIVTIAAPTIRLEIGGSDASMQWYLAAYTLAFAVSLVTSARIGDIVGRRTMFLIGMAGFTAASLACGLATGSGMLIAFRLAQGAFGAAMIPQGLALIKAAFPPDQLQKAFSAFGPVMGLAAVMGPVVAGVLLDADVFGTGWRAIFLVNVPIGVIAVIAAWRYLPDLRLAGTPVRLDPIGALLVTLGSAMLVYPLVQGHELGWPWWTFALIAGSLVVFGLLALNLRHSPDPVIEPSLFGNRAYVGGLAVILTMFVSMMGLMFAFNVFIQLGLHYTALHAGLSFVPWSFGIAVGSALAGAWLGPKYGRRCMQGGMLVVMGGLAALWWTFHTAGAGTTTWDITPATLIAGIGSGMIFAPMFDIILAGVRDREVGSASGVLNAFQQFGGAIAVAVVGSAFFMLVPRDGFTLTMEKITALCIALYLVSLACTLLLPRMPRREIGSESAAPDPLGDEDRRPLEDHVVV